MPNYFSTSAEQNKQPILDRLLDILPTHGQALEVASGSGQHAAWFARHLPGWTWQPTDLGDQHFSAIDFHAQQAGVRQRVRQPLILDVCTAPEDWAARDAAAPPPNGYDLVYCANMIHISPWSACIGLMRWAARYLAPSGLLVTYGPYFEQGVMTAPGNLDFDAQLRARDPQWGVRWREQVQHAALQAGLHLRQRHAMPVNNLLLVWGRE